MAAALQPVTTGRARIIRGAAQAAGVDNAVIEDVFDRLQQELPADWPGTRAWLEHQSSLTPEQIDSLFTYLQSVDGGVAGDDPRAAFEPVHSGTAEWIQPGSRIYRVGTDYYLGEGHQVWPADDTHFHDGTHTYDISGTLVPLPGEAPHADAGIAEQVRSIIAGAIAAVPGAETLTRDELHEVLTRLPGATAQESV